MITIFLEDGKSLESQKNVPKVKHSYSVKNKWSVGKDAQSLTKAKPSEDALTIRDVIS